MIIMQQSGGLGKVPLQYRNRRGDIYYVFQGQTKTGKPKYFVSKSDYSDAGDPIDALPAGFEIVESPANAAVSVRRCKPTRVLPTERELVSRLVLQLTKFSVEQSVIDGDRIIVHTPDNDPVIVNATIKKLLGYSAKSDDWTASRTRFTAMLRFTLVEDENRIFSVERYCFRGSFEGWIPVGHRGPLEEVARHVIPKLGNDSFFELV